MKKINFIIISLLIIFSFYTVSCRNIFRIYTEWERQVELWNKETIKVKNKHSRWVYLLHIHSLPTIGGGDDKYEVEFIYKGKNYLWKGIHFPIALQIDRSGMYIICFDDYPGFEDNCDPNATDGLFYEKLCKHSRFWFYKYSNRIWVETDNKSLPKYLAIQNINTWLWSPWHLNGPRTPVKGEYNFWKDMLYGSFCDSITANLWYYLQNNKYMKDNNCCVDKKFIENYYNKWIYK